MDEKQLIEGCINGDRRAQKALYDRFSRRMMAVCLRYVKDSEDSRDLLQEGFVKVYTNICKFTGEGSFDGWVRKIFVNCALEFLRRNDILANSDCIDDREYEDLPDETTLSQISAEDIMTCVRSLPDGFRVVFNMFAIEGYSHKEIGKILNIKESTSRSQYIRARKALQKMILKH
ncbi:MAG: sigma-70 family RNA polymerase sigma factor [Tannerella sp.]|jgi:RNA polymerase sigma-70 factor (ECF subfamily)|nr:sigma-70 family RNA polymerase sigma factor [Tannerella sp.]